MHDVLQNYVTMKVIVITSNHTPLFARRGGRRATEQKSESECIDTVCIVHGFMNNIIHNSSCMINIDHWMKDC